MVGSSIVRLLLKNNFKNVITCPRKNLDLTNQHGVNDFFKKNKPDYVFLAAAKVGGIKANNKYKADFIYQNLAIQNNVIFYSHLNDVKKLIFLGSSCVYPRKCEQPIKEELLLTGPLEKTNEPYAIAKISGIKMCESFYRQYGSEFFSLMPTNLYGPGDNYDLDNSHVIPALIRKFDDAKRNNIKSVEIWGTGKPMREFLHVDDLADACLFALENISAKKLYDECEVSQLNIGSGLDISIKELALLIAKIISFKGEIIFNSNMPDGTYKKLLDVSLAKKLGWKNKIDFKIGLERVIKLYQRQVFEK